MQYKKPPFPVDDLLCLLFVSLPCCGVDYLYYIDWTYNDKPIPWDTAIFLAAIELVFIVNMIREVVKYFIIVGYMQDDKYIICTDFKNDRDVEVHDDEEGHHINVYSVTYAKIIDGNGKVRKLKSRRFNINDNPFEDGRTEIKVFIDIDNPKSPYYMYPYSEE